MHYYECWFNGTDELIAEGWSVGDDGLLDQTFFCKTERPIESVDDMKAHLASTFQPGDEHYENLINCIRPDTAMSLHSFNEIEDVEFTIGCGLPF